MLTIQSHLVFKNPISEKEKEIFGKILAAAEMDGMEPYVVGGWVRDKIICRESKDIDIAIYSEKDTLLAANKIYFNLTGEFPNEINVIGTTSLNIDGYDIEFTPFRKETYQKDSSKPEIEPGNLETELNRRDFTCNSLAMNLKTYEVIDITGRGIHDIKYEILDTTQSPLVTFTEDPNRIMRLFRFIAQIGFNPHPRVIEIIKKPDVLDLLDPSNRGIKIDGTRSQKATAREENFKQFYKMLIGEKSKNIVKSLEDMAETGAFERIVGFPSHYLPLNTPHANRYHHLGIWKHSLEVLKNIDERLPENADDRFVLRMAAIFHDIGKFDPEIRKPHKKLAGYFTYQNHMLSSLDVSKETFEKYILIPNTEQKLRDRILNIIKLHDSLMDCERLRKSHVYHISRKACFENRKFECDIDNLITFFYADRKAHKEPLNYDSIEMFEKYKNELGDIVFDSLSWLITGDDIVENMSNNADKKFIGKIKHEIISAYIDGQISDREQALNLMIEKMQQKHILKPIPSIVSSEHIVEYFMPYFKQKGPWIKDFIQKSKILERKGLNFDEIISKLDEEIENKKCFQKL